MQKAPRTIILGPHEPSEGFRGLSFGHDPGFENPCVRHCVACLLNRLCGAGKLARNLARLATRSSVYRISKYTYKLYVEYLYFSVPYVQ